jgi:hypothetical protein
MITGPLASTRPHQEENSITDTEPDSSVSSGITESVSLLDGTGLATGRYGPLNK